MNKQNRWANSILSAPSQGEMVRLGIAMLAGGLLAVLIIVLLGALRGGGTPVAAQNANSSNSVAAATVPVAASSASAAVAATDPTKPLGLPVTRGDWVIIKDYAANGGLKAHPANNQGAIDIGFTNTAGAVGADIVATHSGKVKLLRDDPTYGNLVYVLGTTWNTTYGHLQDFTVKEGDTVKRGQVIGHMGATGTVTGPQLDYQVWEKGVNKNPMDYCNCSGTKGTP